MAVFTKILFAACLASAALAKDGNYATPLGHAHPSHPYSFSYAVKDPHTYNDYGHMQTSDGHVVKGEYKVALPDGRLQIVSYIADEYGYRADVKYVGEAHYPKTVYPAPVVHHAPSVHHGSYASPAAPLPAFAGHATSHVKYNHQVPASPLNINHVAAAIEEAEAKGKY